MFKLVSIFIGASLLSACFGISTANGGKDAASPRVTGTVTYLERVALPPTAVIKVQLVDVSRADAPAVALGEQIISTGGKQVPFFFEIPYDPAKIEANHTYAVQARIEVDGRLRGLSTISATRSSRVTHRCTWICYCGRSTAKSLTGSKGRPDR